VVSNLWYQSGPVLKKTASKRLLDNIKIQGTENISDEAVQRAIERGPLITRLRDELNDKNRELAEVTARLGKWTKKNIFFGLFCLFFFGIFFYGIFFLTGIFFLLVQVTFWNFVVSGSFAEILVWHFLCLIGLIWDFWLTFFWNYVL